MGMFREETGVVARKKSKQCGGSFTPKSIKRANSKAPRW